MCRPHRDSRYDVVADALGMVRCAHDRDDEGFTYLLDVADLRSACEFLAQLAEDIIGQLADGYDTAPARILAAIRDRQLGPGREWLQDLTELAGAASEGLAAQRRRWLATDQPWPLGLVSACATRRRPGRGRTSRCRAWRG
jgi:hypothetical protein